MKLAAYSLHETAGQISGEAHIMIRLYLAGIN